jgi:tryptophanyl-tRNA synthetase
MIVEDTQQVEYGTFEASLERSKRMEADLLVNPGKYRMLTGDRPTGRLHVGHLFGSLQNRVRLQNLGIEVFVVIADYQVLTDRDQADSIAENVKQLTIDYLACGLDPEKGNTVIFAHSHVPELNQLLLPFLTLVSMAELDRNPTVKEEIQAAGLTRINACMYTYPVHQAADILFCKANVVPVGKDQLPHLELTRIIARRFNARFSPDAPVFPEPAALLGAAPVILGLDGGQKMSKSRNNAIMLSSTDDETAQLLKRAKTDSDRNISYDPDKRPEVANLLRIASLATGETPEAIAARIGDGGGGKLKQTVTDALNAYLAPIRKRRAELEARPDYVREVILRGNQRAREAGAKTLDEVRRAMNMQI